jgi:hypothetical protein
VCDCKSYNQPKPYQKTPEVVLYVPTWVSEERETICVDACISDAVQHLWKHRIWTLNSCCGHGDLNKRSIIIDKSDRRKAEALLASFDHTVRVGAWELVYSEPCNG